MRGPFGGSSSGYGLPQAAAAATNGGLFMGLGVSLILSAVGAILTWAVTAHPNGVDLQTVGVILMVVGIAGGLISLVFWSSWGGVGGYRRDVIARDRDRVIEK
jgi:hypothetical protein